MKNLIISLFAGILFGLGLCISEMVNPKKVIAFLDITGSWDPSLGVVMIGALTVTTLSFRYVLKRSKPIIYAEFNLPTSKQVDYRLIIGAAIFGIGWALSGFCPGPAIASLAFGLSKSILFIISMILGMFINNALIKEQ